MIRACMRCVGFFILALCCSTLRGQSSVDGDFVMELNSRFFLGRIQATEGVGGESASGSFEWIGERSGVPYQLKGSVTDASFSEGKATLFVRITEVRGTNHVRTGWTFVCELNDANGEGVEGDTMSLVWLTGSSAQWGPARLIQGNLEVNHCSVSRMEGDFSVEVGGLVYEAIVDAQEATSTSAASGNFEWHGVRRGTPYVIFGKVDDAIISADSAEVWVTVTAVNGSDHVRAGWKFRYSLVKGETSESPSTMELQWLVGSRVHWGPSPIVQGDFEIHRCQTARMEGDFSVRIGRRTFDAKVSAEVNHDSSVSGSFVWNGVRRRRPYTITGVVTKGTIENGVSKLRVTVTKVTGTRHVRPGWRFRYKLVKNSDAAEASTMQLKWLQGSRAKWGPVPIIDGTLDFFND